MNLRDNRRRFLLAMRTVRILLLAVLLTIVTGCNVTLTHFEGPTSVQGGTEFDLILRGSCSTNTGSAHLIFQLPSGFQLVGSTLSGPWSYLWFANGTEAIDLPQVLAAYQPEPGHVLHSFTFTQPGYPTNTANAFRVRVRAPQNPGSFTLKAAIARGVVTPGVPYPGVTTPLLPAGGTIDFSLIGSPLHTHPITVTPSSVPVPGVWHAQSEGLPSTVRAFFTGILSRDFDQDGRDDLLFRVSELDNVIFYGDQNDQWAPAQPLPTLTQASFLATPMNWNLIHSIWLNQTPGSTMRLCTLASGDFNGDGLPDFASSGYPEVWLGAPGRNFTSGSVGLPTSSADMLYYSQIATGDINGDGFDDIVHAGHTPDSLQCFLSNGNGSWTPSNAGLPMPLANPNTPHVPGMVEAHGVHILDLNTDGFLDILRLHDGGFTFWLGDGIGNWTQQPSITAAGTLLRAASLDLDGDGDLDLVVASGQDRRYNPSEMPPVTFFQVPLIFPLQPPSGGLLFYRNQGSASPAFVQDTTIGLVPHTVGTEFGGVSCLDLNGDGALDLVATQNAPRFGIRAWLNNPTAADFSPVNLPGVPGDFFQPAFRLATGDFNDDGKDDFAVALPYHGVRAWSQRELMPALTNGGNGAGAAGAQQTQSSVDVLLVNGCSALPSRCLPVAIGTPIDVSIDQPPGCTAASSWMIFGEIGTPNPQAAFTTGIGTFVVPPLPLAASPGRFVLGASLGLGPSMAVGGFAPWTLSFPTGVGSALDFTLQGIVTQPGVVEAPVAITNAIMVRVY